MADEMKKVEKQKSQLEKVAEFLGLSKTGSDIKHENCECKEGETCPECAGKKKSALQEAMEAE